MFWHFEIFPVWNTKNKVYVLVKSAGITGFCCLGCGRELESSRNILRVCIYLMK